MRIVRSDEVAEITLLLPARADRADAVAALHAAFRMQAGDVIVDTIARTASRGGRRLPLTPREFGLLACFARAPGDRITRAMLLRAVWGLDLAGSNFVEVHLSRLRAKLRDARAAVRIETLPEGGWRLIA